MENDDEKVPRAKVELKLGPTWFLLYVAVLVTLGFLLFIAKL